MEMMDSLRSLNIGEKRCCYSDCRREFTEEHKGMACAACHIALYCNSQCQRAAWARHKVECKLQRERVEKKEPDGSWSEPYTGADLVHYVGMTNNLICSMARSALKIGRSDSLAESHYLHFQLDYTTPSRKRWNLSSDKRPVGDERKYFMYQRVAISEDEDLPDGGVQKKARCKAKTQNSNESVFYCMFEAIPLDPSTAKPAVYGNYFFASDASSKRPAFGLPYADRALNQRWPELMDIYESIPSVGKAVDEEKEGEILEVFDLVMSEKISFLEGLPFHPRTAIVGGTWRNLKQKVDSM